MKGFGYALKGLRIAISSQVNFRTHLIAFMGVIALGYFTHLSLREWILVLLCSGLVLVSELFNTAIEFLVDLASPSIHPLAGKIKDVAAAAVLVSALTAACVGLLIFIPKIYHLLF